MLKPTTKDPWILAGGAIAIVVLGFGFLAFQAWLLGIVLGWFGVALGFWKCFVIVFFVGCLTGGSRASS
jgi:hypothetical protein